VKASPEDLLVFTALTPAVKRTAAFLAQGLSLAETAQKLGIEPSTVHSYRLRLFEVIGIRPAIKLAVYIVRRPEIERLLREAL
jgi:DNA-binding NarL/FixJ family response regulator